MDDGTAGHGHREARSPYLVLVRSTVVAGRVHATQPVSLPNDEDTRM